MFRQGDSVILQSFTGMPLCRTEIMLADKNLVAILKKDGTQVFFSQKTGKQVTPRPSRMGYASSIVKDDGSFTEPNKRTRRRNT